MKNIPDCVRELAREGMAIDDALALRRISHRLHRWHELECGIDSGGVERCESTGAVTWYDSRTGKRSPHRDYETPALKRLTKIMSKYPFAWRYYVQGDPRGCALYILSPKTKDDGQPDPFGYAERVFREPERKDLWTLSVHRRKSCPRSRQKKRCPGNQVLCP